MLGRHKVANLGYLSLAMIGSAFALNQSLFIAGLSEQTTNTGSPTTQEQNKPITAAPAVPVPKTPLAELHASLQRAEAALAAVEALESSPKQTEWKNISWQVESKKSRTPSFMLRDEIREYDVITLKPSELIYPEKGDQMHMPLLNGEKVVVDVKASKVNPNGDYSWSGHVQGFGTDYPVVMTYGKDSIFAMITTPKGSYSMESVNGVGWLYKNPAEHELTAPGHDDFLEVPEHKIREHNQEEATMES